MIWKNKKQAFAARPNGEAEYSAIAKASTELVWMKMLLDELGFPTIDPMKLWCDNQAKIHIPVFHKRTKHVELDCHSIRDKVK